MTIRTYKPRRGRVSARPRDAISVDDALFITPDAVETTIATWPGPVILEIGFGTGSATAEMVEADRSTMVIAIDVHTSGVGQLLDGARKRGLNNLAVLEADAITVLREHTPDSSLDGVRSFFPDPWPKARHHKRRLVTPEHAALLAAKAKQGASWHLATDWPEYADQMQEVLDASPHWTGGVIERPAWRPVTYFERRAITDGRAITDLFYRRITPASS
jgi:tRNA (guanine-N7-)-methyltransferase